MENQESLILQKKGLMEEIVKNLSKWDKSPEQAMNILLKNKETIDAMQVIDQKLTEEELASYNREHHGQWQEIISKQEELNQLIIEEKNMIEKQLIQMGRKDKVVSNYINLQKESAFIEKEY